MVAAAAAVSVAATQTTTYHVDGGSGSCSDNGPGSEAQPWCSIPDAPPAGSEVVVHAMGASYGYVNPRSANVTYRGEDAPDVSGLAAAMAPSVFAGRTMPEVGDVDFGASGVVWTGFRHVGVTGSSVALDVLQADDARIVGNEIDYGGIRLRDADRTVIRGNYMHNGPTQGDGRAAIFCPCALLNHTYNGVGSNDTVFQFNRIDDWRGDIVNVQNSGSGVKLLYNRGVHIEREPESDEHTDTFRLVGSGDVTIVGNDFRDVQHGLLITDRTPQDRGDADNRAITVVNNIIEARNGRSYLGPPGPNSLVANNTFVRAETWDDYRDGHGEIDGNDWAGECDVDWTQSRDPGAHSQGAVFANNFCKGSPSLADSRITQSANIWIPRFEDFNFLPDYELPAGSPAVDAANAAYVPPVDGLSRPRVGPPDIGARERQGSDPPPPSDRDGDGVPDVLDACPDEAGSEPDGCNPPPPTDSDGDGFPDNSDLCPAEPGVAPAGCPEIVPPPGGDELRWSAEADRSPHAGLQGASLSGQVCVFLNNDPAKTGPVRFHLDEPPDSSPWRTESSPPWDFFGGSSTACTLRSLRRAGTPSRRCGRTVGTPPRSPLAVCLRLLRPTPTATGSLTGQTCVPAWRARLRTAARPPSRSPVWVYCA